MSATRLAAKASFRRRRTMKQRLEARGVRNLPGTPAAPQGRSFTFDDGEEQNTARRSLRLSALSKGGDGVGTGIDASVQRWVRMPAAEEDGGGHYYVPATVVGMGKRSGTVVCQTDGGAGEEPAQFSAEITDIGPAIDMAEDAAADEDVPNMVNIVNVHEATILNNLQKRFRRDEFMTAVGPILVVVNPFKFFSQKYGPDVIRRYRDDPSLGIREPHVYQVAQVAFEQLGSERATQAILISGESGAGKTETTKKCLQYLSEVAGSDEQGIDARILSANPVLEAFGNAQTLRNNNSSRFGKWLEIHFSEDSLRIVGCNTVNYLLEKTRVVGCGPGEQSYHIFYQMLAGMDADERAGTYHLDAGAGPADFRFLTAPGDEGSYTAQRHAIHAQDFDLTVDAMSHLGFSTSQQRGIFRIIAGVLSLGNVGVGSDGGPGGFAALEAGPEAEAALAAAAANLGVDADALGYAICVQRLKIGPDVTEKKLRPEPALENRNSLCKALYGRMFDFIVARFNEGMRPSPGARTLVVGILDIFGFEIFPQNSFEQLCINYANEKLQQHFNRSIFKEEMKACEEEGITQVNVTFADNEDVLHLIESKARGKPQGLLPMLDEEGRVVGGTDEGFFHKIAKVHKANPRLAFKSPRRGLRTGPHDFWIHHFADHVRYDVRGFVDKNRDILVPDLHELMTQSTNTFIASTLFSVGERGDGEGKRRAPAATRRQKTQGGLFAQQLRQLMGILQASTPHYIRCIKPNNEKAAGLFRPGMINRQLACSGVYEAVRIRKQGFPHRFTHREFLRRYWLLASPDSVRGVDLSGEVSRDDVARVLADLSQRIPAFNDACPLGRTKVFIPETHFTFLERYREVMRHRAVYEMQRAARGFLDRRFCRNLKKTRRLLRAAIAARDVGRAQDLLQRVKLRSGRRVLFLQEAQLVRNLVEEHRAREQLRDLLAAPVAAEIPSQLWARRATLRDLVLRAGDAGDDAGAELLGRARIALQIVADMEEVSQALLDAIDNPKVSVLSKAIARATELQATHGDFCSDSIDAARHVLRQATTGAGAGAGAKAAAAAGAGVAAAGAKDSLAPPPQISVHVSAARSTAQREAMSKEEALFADLEERSLSSIVSMSNNLKSSWPRMSEEAKIRKLLLLEGLCESLRSTVRPPPSYGEWSRDRLAAVLLDLRADASKKGRINAAARAAAHRRAGSSKQ